MLKRTTQSFCALALAGSLLLAGPCAAAATKPAQVAVLVSYEGIPFEQALAGVKEYLELQRDPVSCQVFHLQGDAARTHFAIEEIKKNSPRLIVALGSLAVEAAGEAISDLPIIAGMVLNKETFSRFPNITGTILEFPAATQLQWLKRILPQARTVGVLYNPEENRDAIETARQAARKLGLKLEAQEVSSPRELPAALESLSNRIDVLWGIQDSVVLTPQTAKNILLFSFRSRIPFSGLSTAWVKAGALYALDRDYRDVGTICGEMANQVLHEGEVQSMTVQPPRRVIYSLNLNTARQMKLDFPSTLVRAADQLF